MATNYETYSKLLRGDQAGLEFFHGLAETTRGYGDLIADLSLGQFGDWVERGADHLELARQIGNAVRKALAHVEQARRDVEGGRELDIESLTAATAQLAFAAQAWSMGMNAAED